MHFQALKDNRSFEHAPSLAVSDTEIAMADAAVGRAWKRLPEATRARFVERRSNKGHTINTVRYYPFPVLVEQGETESLTPLLDWAGTYGSIVTKIAMAYQSELPTVRRYLQHAVIKHLQPHLTQVLLQYKTHDLLAGAHLGDDFLAGRSVEWNSGAVGGPDEGWQTAKRVFSEWTPDPALKKVFHPMEQDPAPVIQEALHWAYESFCLANNLTPAKTPFTLFLEHDDLYGSTVSICSRLREKGEQIELAFHHELEFRSGRLITGLGRPVDLVYMDCHWEDLSVEHPLIQAALKNAVALDCSPFAHLVLRSKVILALLFTPAFQRAVGLTQDEVTAIERHLMPTYLWRQKTFRIKNRLPAKVLHTLRGRIGMVSRGTNNKPGLRDTIQQPPQEDGLVIKAAVGRTYGGSGVAVLLAETGHDMREAIRLVQDTMRAVTCLSTNLPGQSVLVHVRDRLKSTLKQAVLNSLTGLSPPGSTLAPQKASPFWCALIQAWEDLLARSMKAREPLRPQEFTTAAHRPVAQHLSLSMEELQSATLALWPPLNKALDKLCNKANAGNPDPVALNRAVQCLGDILAHLRFRDETFKESYSRFMNDVRTTAHAGESLGCLDFTRRLLAKVDNFFDQEFHNPLPSQTRRTIEAILQEPYILRQQRAVTPIVFQPYSPPERLNGEDGLHVISRTNIFFTRQCLRVFIAGSQVFYPKAGKPDNRSKMTASYFTAQQMPPFLTQFNENKLNNSGNTLPPN